MISLLPLNLAFKMPFPVQLVYLTVCLILAIIGHNRTMGFWGYLFASMLLSPVIGFLLLAVSSKSTPPKDS